MAKVYESKAPSRMISTAAGKIKFRPETPGGFGQLASDDAYLLSRLQLKLEEVEAIIERQSDFKNRVPGHAGIWLREERVDQTANESFGKIRAELRALGAPALRRKLAEAKLEVPVNATDDELASLVLEAMAQGQLGYKAQTPAPASDESVRPPRPNLRRGAASSRLASED